MLGGGTPSTLGSMFNYLVEFVQLPWGVCSTTMGSIFTTLVSMLPLGVCSTTLGSISNYPGEYVQLPWGVFSTTLGNGVKSIVASPLMLPTFGLFANSIAKRLYAGKKTTIRGLYAGTQNPLIPDTQDFYRNDWIVRILRFC